MSVSMPPGVPQEAAGLFEQLLRQETRSLDALRTEVRAHAERIRLAMGSNEFIDAAVGLSLASTAAALLDEAGRREDDDSHRLVQAAVLYFVLDDDAEHDLRSVCGLDDDAAVLNAVARKLGRDDLVVEI